MKRLFTLFISATFACITLFAQEADIRRVAEQYKNMHTMTATATRTRHNAAVADDVVTKGEFYFKNPDKMCMRFNDGKDMLLMDGNIFTMVNDGKKSIAKGETARQFESLQTVFMYLFSGKENNNGIKKPADNETRDLADVEITKQNHICVVTVTPIVPDSKAKRRLMFTSFVLTIDTQSSEFKSLRMNEKGKNYTQYDLSGYVLNAAVNDSVFHPQP